VHWAQTLNAGKCGNDTLVVDTVGLKARVLIRINGVMFSFI
jgi:hypothetical protein